MRRYLNTILWATLLVGSPCAFGQPAKATMAFTVSMPEPSTHKFHVTFRCDGLKGEMQDFKMPAWMPGFYRIMDYEKNVMNFHAEDGAGGALPWEKVTKNTWRVVSGNAPAIILNYDVFGNTSFAANNYLSDQRAFIAPPGLYMYVAGQSSIPRPSRSSCPRTGNR